MIKDAILCSHHNIHLPCIPLEIKRMMLTQTWKELLAFLNKMATGESARTLTLAGPAVYLLTELLNNSVVVVSSRSQKMHILLVRY